MRAWQELEAAHKRIGESDSEVKAGSDHCRCSKTRTAEQ
jgi:hypothetical protein